MSDDPELNALADQARLSLSPDERGELVAAVHSALAACAVLADEPFGEQPADVDPTSAETDDADDKALAVAQSAAQLEAGLTAPGPPSGVDDDVVELVEGARERFTRLSSAAREGFFVVPRVPHGQGH